ncbi:hypothetical protein Lal_00034579 [Lupinus albus]|uniref:Uncharacterized protein n=1 Tax=Lupinus albus TaxID=3870 RepID=A0A6A4QTD1_LUPAL|nr:hypothetical protein Lalb_Chr03g0031941 [Lupinus albus]KAF1896878.1 hypothetical protein Lal_00034579 [Lupinus albus]
MCEMSDIDATQKLPQPTNFATTQAPQLPIDERIGQLQLAKQKFEEDNQISTPKIQRVPYFLRENVEMAKYYSPKMISFGPIHHKDKNLEQGQRFKLLWTSMYIEEYSKQTSQLITNQVAQTLLNTIEDNLGALKKLFTEDAIGTETSDENLAWMLFVDGCSLLHFMENIDKQHPQPLNLKLDQMMLIWRDILLLENQLPRRLLELLKREDVNLEYLMANLHSMGDVKRSFKNEPESVHILDFARSLLRSKCKKNEVDLEKSTSNSHSMADDKGSRKSRNNKPKPIHILDYARYFVTSTPNEENGDECKQMGPPEKEQNWLTYKNIRDLKAAGIQVKASKKHAWVWSNVSFKSKLFYGELRLPKFVFDNVSPYFFRNLIAYEMCPDFRNNLECCSFVCFMDSLIDSGEDVKELRLSGVIQNLLGSDEELAQIFMDIGRDLPTKVFNNTWSSDAVAYSKRYIEVKDQIEKHYSNKWRTGFAIAINTHFSNTWSVIAFLAAVVALALTCLQTWCTVYPK